MRLIQYIAIVVAVVFAAFVLLRPEGEHSTHADMRHLPWQIEVLPDGGSRVFGLELKRSTLDDARIRFGDGMKIGVVAAQGEAGALEAYYDSVAAGFILGRMILVADIDEQTLKHLRERSVDRSHMNETTFRYVLDAGDLPLALRAPIAGITFIPAADLDADMVRKRFGEPGLRVRTDTRVEHFLYPDRGLDLLLDSDGKEVLQYVAPREFARLQEPLLGGGSRETPE